MIRVNLYPTFEAVTSTPVQQYAILGILLAAMGVGGWYWNVTSTRASLQVTVDQLQAKSIRLQEITAKVEEFEDRKRSLEERIAIIERLKDNQIRACGVDECCNWQRSQQPSRTVADKFGPAR